MNIKKETLPALLTMLIMLIFTFIGQPFTCFAAAINTDMAINADGTITPPTAPITRMGDVYTLTSNFSGTLGIHKANTIFDGAGYTIQTRQNTWAVSIEPTAIVDPTISNITVKNLKITEDPNDSNWAWGILVTSVTDSVIANCSIYDLHEGLGVWLENSCTRNTIIGNTFTNVEQNAIYVCERGNIIVGNRIVDCGSAVHFFSTSDTIIYGNHIEGNGIGIDCFSQNGIPPGLKNTIYCNNFISNNMSFRNQAIFIGDTGVLLVPAIVSLWDNGTMGNFWSDYNGSDANDDGIGDRAYFVEDNYPLEDANDTDHYPLMHSFNVSSVASLPQNAPSPTPTPSPSSTSTVTPSTDPSTTSTTTQNPIATPSPTPKIPELTVQIIGLTLIPIALTALLIIIRKKVNPIAESPLHLPQGD